MDRKSRHRSFKIGEKFKLIRRHFGFSQTKMPAIVHPDFNLDNRAAVSQYETGFAIPDYRIILNYARFAQISGDILLDDERELTNEMLCSRTTESESSEADTGSGMKINPEPASKRAEPPSARLPPPAENAKSNDGATKSAVPTEATDDNDERRATEDSETAKDAENIEAKDEQDDTKGERTEDVRAREFEEFRRPPRRFLPKGKLFDCANPNYQPETIEVSDALLDALDDLYPELLMDVPRSTRPILKRRHFYHALLTAGFINRQEQLERSALAVT